MTPFEIARLELEKQYEHAVFSPATGISLDEVKAIVARHVAANPAEPRVLTRAFVLNLILTRGRFAIETANPFAGKLEGGQFIKEVRQVWWRDELAKRLTPEELEEKERLGVGFMIDVSHVAPAWPDVLALGLPGLKARAEAAGNTPFHRAVAMVYDGAIQFCRRCGAACGNGAMQAIAERAPQTLLEAFVLAYVFHDIAELEGEEVRSMGWFDRQFIEFYRRDLADGRLTRESAKELVKYFWIAFYAKYQGLRFGKNFCFGPEINELSYLGMEVYYEMNTVDPKLSVRVTAETPRDFLELCAKCIRDGRTGVVMLNDDVIVRGLVKHGRTPEDARDFIPIGCYEPAVLGKEASTSGATHIWMSTAMATFMQDDTPYGSFREVVDGYKAFLAHAMDVMVSGQRKCEDAWPHVSPSPFLSGAFAHCVETGKDYTEGGCDYNSTGCVIGNTADAVDSLAAIDYAVFENHLCTLEEIRQACRDNWVGHEHLRDVIRAKAPKYGNNDDRADSLAVELSQFMGPRLNKIANSRGGHFFASIYGQLVVDVGARTGALPSGRLAGTPVAKNMDACIGMDRNGITALMDTVLKIDMVDYPCGTCLDLMLHPSSVTGDDGIQTIVDIIRTFIGRGGSGLQFNIFDASVLRDAQEHPEKYGNLQVRVCGWNSRFVDMRRAEQETFISQAEQL